MKLDQISSLAVSRQRKDQLRHTELGLCQKCSNPALGGLRHCEKCSQKYRESYSRTTNRKTYYCPSRIADGTAKLSGRKLRKIKNVFKATKEYRGMKVGEERFVDARTANKIVHHFWYIGGHCMKKKSGELVKVRRVK